MGAARLKDLGVPGDGVRRRTGRAPERVPHGDLGREGAARVISP